MIQNHNPWQPLAAFILLTLCLACRAEVEPIGYVKTVTGEAWVGSGTQRVKAQPGTAILLGSRLQTGGAASLGVTFRDNTVMSFGPDTEMTVDEYIYSPARNDVKLSTWLLRGTLDYISGAIAKLRPEAVTVRTPAGIIGVRGTQFVVKVEDPQ